MYLSGKDNKMNKPNSRARRTMNDDIKNCSVEQCINKSRKLGMCSKHYTRFKKHGDVNYIGNTHGGKRQCFTKEQQLQKKKDYAFTLSGRFSVLKHKSKKRNLSVEITFEEYQEIVSKQCFFCEGKFKKFEETQGYYVDRADNSIGYTYENCIPCCHICNRIKGDNFTVEQTQAAVEAILMLDEYE